jgi:hypothetical protein
MVDPVDFVQWDYEKTAAGIDSDSCFTRMAGLKNRKLADQ